MEITRTTQVSQTSQVESKATKSAKVPIADSSQEKSSEKAMGSANSTEPRIEQLQSAIRDLPEIDLEQVSAIKRALARGELSVDVRTLAQTILSYHRGN